MKRICPLGSLALALTFACGAAHAVTDQRASFRFSATDADFGHYFPSYLANGYFSTNTSLRGTDANPAYVVGLMDRTKGDVSRPALVPAWAEIDYNDGSASLNGAKLTPQSFAGYRQTLDMYDGVLGTSYRWIDGGKATAVNVETLVSQASPHLGASRISITPDFDGEVELVFPLNGVPAPAPRYALARLSNDEMLAQVARNGQQLKPVAPATADRAALWYPGQTTIDNAGEAVDASASGRVVWLRGHAADGASFAMAAAVAVPAGVRPIDISVTQGADRAALHVRLHVQHGATYRFAKFVALTRDGWGKPDDTLALARAARDGGFDALLAAHTAAWHKLWQSDVLVDGDERVQRAVHSDLFYLLQNTTEDTGWPVMACSFSPGYTGHTFWDSDTWAFPALLLLHPERAKPLVEFRARTLGPALQRAREHGYQGAMYPWESDPDTGTDQTPSFAWHVTEREIHVNADIAIAQWQYYMATGDATWLRREAWPVIKAVAQFWTSRVTPGKEPGTWDLLHVVSTDEDYRDVANDAFTNGVARKALRIATLAAERLGIAPDPRWDRIAAGLPIPFSEAEQRHLDFDPSVPHNLETWIGSALTFLTLPSLDLQMPMNVRRNDWRHELQALEKQSHDPNSMLTVMLAVQAATLGESAVAHDWVQRNLDGFLKPPFNVRSESAENNVGFLLAPSGGFVQNFVYGFTGLRIDDEHGVVPAYGPVLPEQWQGLTIRNASVQGRRYDFVLVRDAAGKPLLKRIPR